MEAIRQDSETGDGGRRDGEIRGAGSRVSSLDECCSVAAPRLRAAVAKGLDQIKPELIRVIDMAMGAESYYLYMGALELVRDHQPGIVAAFHKAFLRRFNQASRDPARHGGPADTARLSLLAPDALEESLATDLLANAIRDNCVEELFGLDKRVGLLVNDPDLVERDNPLGPDVIARAMMDALEPFDAEFKSRLLLMTQLSKRLPDDVRDLYRDLNQLLVRRNVLPTIRVGLRRSEHVAPPPQAEASPAEGLAGVDAAAPVPPGPVPSGQVMAGQAVAAAPSYGDLYALLQRLVGVNAGAAGQAEAAAGKAGAAVETLPSAAIMQSLNQLQRGHAEGLAWSGLAAEALGDGRVNVLHGLRQGGMARAGELDTMTLDIVAMVFDYILDDNRIPDAMQALIGRLQIPVLKVALLDRSFFSSKAHPARRFLDGLAGAAISLDPDDVHESHLYKKAEELVVRILEHFDDHIGIFAEVLAELNAFLAREQDRAAAAVASGIQAIQAREAAELSARAAREVVREGLDGHPVPLAIRDFIVRYWQRLLVDVHQRFGPEGKAWKIAVSTMANLIWSVEPKYDPVERASLVGLIPSLLKELNLGADSLDMPRDDRELFFATLVPCHTLALKAIVLEEVALVQPVMVASPLPPVVESHEFEPLPVAAPAGKRPAAVLPASAESSIEGLSLGSWIEYEGGEGETLATRLAWVSPLKSIYMFADRQGRSVLSITARGLQAKLRTGEVRIVDDVPLLDRAVDNLMEHFQRNAL